jgi:hypothetical protein
MVATEIKKEIKEMLEHFDQQDLSEILAYLKRRDKERQVKTNQLSSLADKIIKEEHNLLKRLAE